MIDAILSLTQAPPRLNEKSLANIYRRISHFFPNLDETGRTQFLSELFNVRSIDECISDEFVFQNIEPSVDREELRVLAERIIGYTNYSLEQAKSVVRSVLNTIPKRFDDLIDYTTEERLKAFKEAANFHLSVYTGKEFHLETLDNIANVFEQLPDVAITLFGNSQMDESRTVSDEAIEAFTVRQKMLYRAGDYYLNHRVGFKTNSMWLACFISSNSFGCLDGWLHRDGELCNNRHFGFKDDDAVVELVLSSLRYLDEYFSRQVEYKGVSSNEAMSFCRTGSMYIEAMLDAVEYIVKCREAKGEFFDNAYESIMAMLDEHSLLLDGRQELKLLTHKVAFDCVTGFTQRQFDLLYEIVEDDYGTQGPPPDMYTFFDAWNFMVYGQQHDIKAMLGPLFLRSNYHRSSLTELSNFVTAQLENDELEKYWEDMFMGYFTNYLFTLVNKNSHSHFLFDEILAASLDARGIVDNKDVVRTMAELGHQRSRQAMNEYY
ncbi:hypothetical protein [Alteromonas gracilis]|uniref:hypothetical protein n=1 Tax=Alteromonas gracilis TaxID=1479524 RepID=UPI00373709FD